MWMVEIVTLLALLQYLWFGVLVGRARGRDGVKAPATTGSPGFERAYRVQMNTLEQLVVFLPALWLAARHWSPLLVALVGLVFLIGRALYARAYARDPASRGLGFMVTAAASGALIAGAAVGIVVDAVRWASLGQGG